VDVHSLREHYVWTVRPWLDRLRERKDEAVALIGPEQYRVWLLYLAGAALAFEENRMGVHQVLMVRPDADGRTGLPPSRTAILGAVPTHPVGSAGSASCHPPGPNLGAGSVPPADGQRAVSP
jgi:cyclopropane-fatty-acyl-phospholipid synthase